MMEGEPTCYEAEAATCEVQPYCQLMRVRMIAVSTPMLRQLNSLDRDSS